MHFTSFEIENYKGIKKARLDLRRSGTTGNVFALVGLNESGKTTLLEAISDFLPGREGLEAIVPRDPKRGIWEECIPKIRKANFSGKIEITAHVSMNDEDRARIVKFAKDEKLGEVDPKSLTDFKIVQAIGFEDSIRKSGLNTWFISFSIRNSKRGQFKKLPANQHWQKIVAFMATELVPRICYCPTFLFDLPERIFLSNPPESRDTKANKYYVQVVQDVLDSLHEDLQLDRHLIDRVNRAYKEDSTTSFSSSDAMQQVDSVMLRISDQLTKVIFGKWNQIFGAQIKNKSIDATLDIEANEDGKLPTISMRISIRDGSSRYSVAERSLGFRWFFCFLLFTQFRVSRKGSSALFLFDEPASNLHSKAQEQLLQSFATISAGENMTIYSTHSHYMIEPRWLEDTFIVSNEAVDPERSPNDEVNTDRSETIVHVQRYRDFVGQRPDKMSYFQPILDKLDYAPSLLNPNQKVVMVEGKNDFYMLSYFREIIFKGEHDYRFIPSSGANDIGPLISLYLGWGRDFIVLLDDDREGTAAAKRYRDEWYLADDRVKTLGQLVPALKGRTLEAVLADGTRQLISAPDLNPSKKQIARFFQELLAQRRLVNLDESTLKSAKMLMDACSRLLIRSKV